MEGLWPSCRLCGKVYVDKLESKHNLFQAKNTENNIIDRLKNVGVYVCRVSGLSDTICRPCFHNVKKVEEAHTIKAKWGNVLVQQTFVSPTEAVKRGLSPSSKKQSSLNKKTVLEEMSERSTDNLPEDITFATPTGATSTKSVGI